jgi:hypothetical protein
LISALYGHLAIFDLCPPFKKKKKKNSYGPIKKKNLLKKGGISFAFFQAKSPL